MPSSMGTQGSRSPVSSPVSPGAKSWQRQFGLGTGGVLSSPRTPPTLNDGVLEMMMLVGLGCRSRHGEGRLVPPPPPDRPLLPDEDEARTRRCGGRGMHLIKFLKVRFSEMLRSALLSAGHQTAGCERRPGSTTTCASRLRSGPLPRSCSAAS